MLMEPRGKRKWRNATVERQSGQDHSPDWIRQLHFLFCGLPAVLLGRQSKTPQATPIRTLSPVEATHNSSTCGGPKAEMRTPSISPHHPLADRHSSAVRGAEAQGAAAAVYIPMSRFCRQIAHHLAACHRGFLHCCWRS